MVSREVETGKVNMRVISMEIIIKSIAANEMNK